MEKNNRRPYLLLGDWQDLEDFSETPCSDVSPTSLHPEEVTIYHSIYTPIPATVLDAYRMSRRHKPCPPND
jgi:hypothetical protein